MRLIGFVCALALAGAVGGCGDDEENGTGGTGGTGATGGSGGATGGTGGAGVMNACTNAPDTTVYEGVMYTNIDGDFTGVQAVSEIASDCVFGDAMEAPNLVSDGCGAEVGVALGNPSPENIQALADCVVQCTIDQGVGLSADCLSCYGESVSLGAAFCAGPCATGTDVPACIDCRCGNNDNMVNIFDQFDICSGLPREINECM